MTAHPGDAGPEGSPGAGQGSLWGPGGKRAFPERALKAGGACQAEQEDRGQGCKGGSVGLRKTGLLSRATRTPGGGEVAA